MKIPGGYRTIEQTGIVRSPSLLQYRVLSFHLSVSTGSLTLVDAQKWPVPASEGRRGTKGGWREFIQSEDINNKI